MNNIQYGIIDSENRLVRVGSKLPTDDGLLIDTASDEAATLRAEKGIKKIVDLKDTCVCEDGFIPKFSRCEETSEVILVHYEPTPIETADARELANSLKGLNISAMKDKEKTLIIKRLADFASKCAVMVMVGLVGVIGNCAELRWSDYAAPKGELTDADLVVTNFNGFAVADEVLSKEDGDKIVRQVNSIGAYLNAEDARFVVTNYDSKTKTPEAYVNIKISNEWITVWREMTRWKEFTGSDFLWDNWTGFSSWKTNLEEELSFKATRNWGMYDSETGGLSPEGYTQVSSPNILIAANAAYQRTITTDGCNVWILQSNLSTTQFGGDTNGNFRILDGDGAVQFEVVKGDKSEQPCDSGGITIDYSTTPNTIKVPFSVESSEHPRLQICEKLETHLWKYEDEQDCIANVTWSGDSGNWLASVQSKTTNLKSMFIKGTYMKGGETYIKNNAPVSMSSIILEENGVRKKYYLGTAVIDGKTVLTLSTTP